jgi:hypothetical protein
MAYAVFSYISRVPLLSHEKRETNSHHPHSPIWVEGIDMTGAARCPEGIVSDTAITTSVLRSPRYDTLHLGFSGPEPSSLSKDVTLSATRTPRFGFWMGLRTYLTNVYLI